MKTLSSSLRFANSDPAQFRLHVLEHGKKYGVASAIAAFGISRRTYFNWNSKFTQTHGRLVALVPRSTRPHHTRRMLTDERIIAFIREVREEYGRVGKNKLKVLLDAYTHSIHIPTCSASQLGKIIKRYHFFFDPPKKTRRLRFQRQRVKYAPKITQPGYLEMDSVHVMVETTKLVFITVIDLATKVAYAERVRSATSVNAQQVLAHFRQLHTINIHIIQTDNGSEFLGTFHEYLEAEGLQHRFSYPRSPRINGVIERFNRTLQEEHVERTLEWWCDPPVATAKLRLYLDWYNAKRPHQALGYQTPLAYLKTVTESAIST